MCYWAEILLRSSEIFRQADWFSHRFRSLSPKLLPAGENVALNSDNAVRFSSAGDLMIKEVLSPDLQGSEFQLSKPASNQDDPQ
jgi:hypothetical protein